MGKFLFSLLVALVFGAAYRILRDDADARLAVMVRPR